MDAGKKEVIIMSDHLFKPQNFAIMIPNVIYDFSKVLFWKVLPVEDQERVFAIAITGQTQ